MAFDAVNAALILSKGVGCPPNDMQSFNATSQEDGIKVTFTGPKNSYVFGAANNDTLLSTPAGVMIRYSDTDYPADITDGTLLGIYTEDYDPVNPTEVTDNLIGLVFEQTYYFSAFPFSVDGIYNKSQAPANRASCQWVGNKGTINVTVSTYEGYTGGEIGEYTITLVDQASSGPQNIQRTASGIGLTQIGNLDEGKTYVVTLTDVGGLTCDPSEPITIVAGETYNVTMTFREKYGTISVTVNTANDVYTLGEYTITLLDQSSESPSNIEKQANGKTTSVFENLIAGKQYKVRLGAAQNFIAPADSDTLTVIGGGDVPITMTYSPGLGSVVVNVSTNPTGMPIGSYTITLTPTAGGSSLQQSGSGSQSLTFNSVPIGTYNITGSSINHYTFSGGQVSVTGGQQSSHNANYRFNQSFAEATWEELDAIAETNNAASVFNIHDERDILIAGFNLKFEIVGFNHDIKSSGGYAGISIALKNLMPRTRQMNDTNTNVGSFTGSSMYDYLNTSVYNSLPAGLKAIIKPVDKKTSAGNKSATVNTESMKIWLFSANEVAGPQDASKVSNNEGSKYPAFFNNDSRVKKLNNGSGEANWWWLRSPRLDAYEIFCSIYRSGYVYEYYGASTEGGVCFGFCI